MPYENKYPNSKLLLKIVTALDLKDCGESMPFPFKLFKKVMMDREDIEPVISYPRTLMQKFQDLRDCDYIYGDDDHTRLDIPAVFEKLRTMELIQ